MQSMRFVCFLFITIFNMFSLPAWGAESSLSLQEILQSVLHQQPNIALARLQQQRQHIEHDNIEGMLDARISLSGHISDETNPTTNPFSASQTRLGRISGSITKPWENGSSLTASLNYNHTRLSYPATVPSAFQSSLNPSYQHQIDLIYRYPLLRGFANPNYHEQLKSNQYNEQAAAWNIAIQQENLTAQTIALY